MASQPDRYMTSSLLSIMMNSCTHTDWLRVQSDKFWLCSIEEFSFGHLKWPFSRTQTVLLITQCIVRSAPRPTYMIFLILTTVIKTNIQQSRRLFASRLKYFCEPKCFCGSAPSLSFAGETQSPVDHIICDSFKSRSWLTNYNGQFIVLDLWWHLLKA
jgi:hypothetical protein